MLKKEQYKKEVIYTNEHIYCELCSKEIEEKWNDNEEEVKIEFTYEYSNWPEGGYENKLVYDICPECFKKEIQPFLNSKVTPRVERRDW